ncbi:MAG: DUF3500 domain-containing protein [Verrucomicrobia bacterium]|nr:DUF3500 domain-containing protein [Verrucomicrobiota bacterium]
MKIHQYGPLVVLLSFPLTASLSQGAAAPAPGRGASVEEATLKAVSAAKTFLATLDDRLRSKVSLPLNAKTRANWSNLPTGATFQSGATERNGVKLGDLTPVQQEAALALVAATLSPGGYQKVINIVNADETLERTSAPTRAASSRTRFGRAEFYVAILGAPSATQAWMIQFGGHHLALNITVVGGQNVLTPSHTGTQPSNFTFDGKSVRPLGSENDKAFALINALDATQRKQATLDYQVRDVVAGPGHDGEVIQPEGVRVSAFNPAQRAMLLDLIKEWVGIVNDSAAAAKMAEIQTKLADTYFAWSGPTTNGSSAYFRIHGPTVMIEYAPQRGGTDHIHTFYRDPGNDYGAKLIKP